jgi:hypothetical protein
VAARWRDFNKMTIHSALHKASLQGVTA